MRAGDLRHRVTIQSASESVSAAGEVTKTWSDVATVWASIEPLTGREKWLAEQVQAAATHRVRMRYRSDVGLENRLLYGSRVLDILEVMNTGERDKELVLICAEAL